MRQRQRWAVVAGLLALGALVSPSAVPLYDGVGFPDEPYRFVPPRSSNDFVASAARVQLRVVDGVNAGGLLANSSELGPQVSVYAPPKAFQVAGLPKTSEIRLRADPVPVTPPAPPGELESNAYLLSLRSPDGPVSLRSDAQQPGITLRAVSVKEPLPVMHYRAKAGEPWQALATRRVGRDNFNATAPGEGEYVLTRLGSAKQQSEGGNRGLLLLVGAVVLVMIGVVVGVRVLSGRQSEG
jgi:hypothetical protein